jgi:uncharacterized UPF0160 family protein
MTTLSITTNNYDDANEVSETDKLIKSYQQWSNSYNCKYSSSNIIFSRFGKPVNLPSLFERSDKQQYYHSYKNDSCYV